MNAQLIGYLASERYITQNHVNAQNKFRKQKNVFYYSFTLMENIRISKKY